MKNLKGYLGMALAMAMMSQESMMDYKETPREYTPPPKKDIEPIIPKGCKKYYFRKSGVFNIGEDMWNDIDYIFTCVASNDKNAIKKFNSFIDKKQQNES